MDLTNAIRRLTPKQADKTGESTPGGWRTPDSVMSTGSRSAISSLNGTRRAEKLKVRTFYAFLRIHDRVSPVRLLRKSFAINDVKAFFSGLAFSSWYVELGNEWCPTRHSHVAHFTAVFRSRNTLTTAFLHLTKQRDAAHDSYVSTQSRGNIVSVERASVSVGLSSDDPHCFSP